MKQEKTYNRKTILEEITKTETVDGMVYRDIDPYKLVNFLFKILQVVMTPEQLEIIKDKNENK